MRSTIFLLLALGTGLLYSPATAPAQSAGLRIGQWRNFTNMDGIRSVAVSGDSLWAATSGGLFLYRVSTGEYTMFTNTDGLSNNDLTCVALDRQGRIWTGASNGALNVLSPASGAIQEIADIAASDRVQKSILRLVPAGDTMFVATEFGVSIYRISRSQFGDSYINFGFPLPTQVNDVLKTEDSIWVATDYGVAAVSLKALNPAGPTEWKRYTLSDGLPSATIQAITRRFGSIAVGTPAGAARFTGGSFQTVPATSGMNVLDFAGNAATLLMLTATGTASTVISMSSWQSSPVTAATAAPGGVRLAQGTTPGDLAIATSSRKVAFVHNGGTAYLAPNGPASNNFPFIAIDQDGILWSASGLDAQGKGFYRLNPALPVSSRWKNFAVADYPVMGSNDYFQAAAGADGSMWLCSWGSGLIEIKGDTIRRRLTWNTTPSLGGTLKSDTTYVIGGAPVVDHSGSTWLLAFNSVNKSALMRLTSDISAEYIADALSPAGRSLMGAVADHNGTLWFWNSTASKKFEQGLIYYSPDRAVTGTTSTGGWGVLTSDNGLPDNVVMCVANDDQDNIWVGTNTGVLVIANTLDPKSSTSKPYSLRRQTVQAIAVDAAGNKWVGTKEGLLVMNSDGTQLLQQYTVASTNGKLLNDDIRSIAIDHKRGIVYIGTQYGLSSLGIAATSVARSAGTLEIGPNPFVIPSDRPLKIRGIASLPSTVKILSIDGRLVRELSGHEYSSSSSPGIYGGTALWDGRNNTGDLVGSGVYFIYAYASNGSQISTGKVAVVRK